MKFYNYFSLYLKDKKIRLLSLFLIVFLLINLLISFLSTQKESSSFDEKDESIDTLIPKGFTLVPIEIQNAESISSLFDRFAVVNLYSNGGFGSKSNTLVGNNVKLLRAPLNPEKFAVLVPESKAGQIIANQLPLFAVILSRAKNHEVEILSKPTRKFKVDYYNEVKK